MAHDRDQSMVSIRGGKARLGSSNHYPEEAPVRQVDVGDFWMDRGPVSNRQFAAFVRATGYVTTAERPLDPHAYPGVRKEDLKPGALVFRPTRKNASAGAWPDWWSYTAGAHWRKPEAGPSVFRNRWDHPVVCVSYEDAETYARWSGKTLPTEAVWEYAARGGLVDMEYAWGSELYPDGKAVAHIWRGPFPHRRVDDGGYPRTAPIGRYPPNGYGLLDMIGNVWEWTSDWYLSVPAILTTKACCAQAMQPPATSYDPALPDIRIPRRVVKGGSFLCAENYCRRYRPAARQPQMVDTAACHIGFRCVIR
jgi:sulfatase modifying factor 1